MGLTSIGIVGEVSGPLDESRAFELAAGDCVGTNSAHDGGVGQLWLGSDDGVGDIVIDRLPGR